MKSVALALTWDGVRWPAKKLPPKAQAFLAGRTSPTPKEVAKFFSDDQIQELRICWVPRLKGGSDVLSEPFSVPQSRRIQFEVVRTNHFDDILAVTYRRRPIKT